jgi:hypothetical protein
MNKNKPVNFDSLSEQQLSDIKSMAVRKYTESNRRFINNDNLQVDSIVYGFLCFLNSHGYELTKKEEKDEQ